VKKAEIRGTKNRGGSKDIGPKNSGGSRDNWGPRTGEGSEIIRDQVHGREQ